MIFSLFYFTVARSGLLNLLYLWITGSKPCWFDSSSCGCACNLNYGNDGSVVRRRSNYWFQCALSDIIIIIMIIIKGSVPMVTSFISIGIFGEPRLSSRPNYKLITTKIKANKTTNKIKYLAHWLN